MGLVGGLPGCRGLACSAVFDFCVLDRLRLLGFGLFGALWVGGLLVCCVYGR